LTFLSAKDEGKIIIKSIVSTHDKASSILWAYLPMGMIRLIISCNDPDAFVETLPVGDFLQNN